MTGMVQSYRNFRFLVRGVRWVELLICALIVVFAREVASLSFPRVPVLIVFVLGMLWNTAFWYAGRRHLLHERGPVGARLLVWSWVVADVVTNLLVVLFTGGTASPFLFFLAFPVILSTIALGRSRACYGVAVGSAFGLGAIWAMQDAGSIPEYAAYAPITQGQLTTPQAAAAVLVILGAVLSLLVYTVFRFRPNFFIFQESLKDGRFRIQNFRAGHLRELQLDQVEVVGPEDLLEEAVQGLTLARDISFGAAVVLPSGGETIGGAVGNAWHQGLTAQRAVCTTRRQVIPTWSECDAGSAALFESLQNGENGDLFEGSFNALQENGLFASIDAADSYLATAIGDMGRPVVLLIAGVCHPVEDRSAVVMHLFHVAAQLKPLLAAESRMSQMRGELSALHTENESLSRINKLQSDFVSIASHELKTPLTAIGAYTDALMVNAENVDFAERAEFLSVIRHENDRLLRMINRILDFSQIEFGHRALSRRRVNLRALVEDTLRTLRPQIEEQSIKVQIETDPTLGEISVDPDLTKQVFLNLIGNATKFSPAHTEITVGIEEEATRMVAFVRDEGPGIPAGEIQHVFKQFYRVRDESREMPDGSGLGLAIVKNILDMHGGSIDVESAEGEGACFRFSLPKQKCTNHEAPTVLGEVSVRPEFKHLMSLLVQMLADYMNCKIVSVMLLTADRESLRVQVAYGLDEEVVRRTSVDVGEGIAGSVVASGRPLLVEDIHRDRSGDFPNQKQYDTNSLVSVPMRIDDEVIGVINCNNKVTGEPFNADDLGLLITLSEKVTRALSRALRFEDVRDELERTIGAIEALIEMESSEVGTSRLAVRLAMDLARRMGLTRQQILALQYACLIHDVGMTSVAPEIVSKRGPLTDEEFALVRSHPNEGVHLIEPFLSSDEVDEIIRYHHERVDGSGYPSGLAGEHIPLPARILAVIDAYDSMTSNRPYRSSRSPMEAAAELVEHSGKQFDVEVVRAFLDVLAENAELSRREYLTLKEMQPWLHPVS
jgi:signal transduction histidine kinase/HD-GYP domain-containing protein (c-di-GMP phosphodiesterase class II)